MEDAFREQLELEMRHTSRMLDDEYYTVERAGSRLHYHASSAAAALSTHLPSNSSSLRPDMSAERRRDVLANLRVEREYGRPSSSDHTPLSDWDTLRNMLPSSISASGASDHYQMDADVSLSPDAAAAAAGGGSPSMAGGDSGSEGSGAGGSGGGGASAAGRAGVAPGGYAAPPAAAADDLSGDSLNSDDDEPDDAADAPAANEDVYYASDLLGHHSSASSSSSSSSSASLLTPRMLRHSGAARTNHALPP
ncbi:hypothetical protein JKP88DRAFT_287105 [Tribonema minus]|uniref:Uncharacterized protein n=1 Tax=Tribonema minus TaxID=303371 RepID=A0A836CML7_9STRA|nr:hypothetical protein JKP88DRAFT_287105 [Tribonema minus]